MPGKTKQPPAEEPMRSIAGKTAGSLEARITMRNPIDVDDAADLVPLPTLAEIEGAIKAGLAFFAADKSGEQQWGIHVAATWTSK
jgi:hypothetical protein